MATIHPSAVPEPPSTPRLLVDVLEAIGRRRRLHRFGGQKRSANAGPATKLSLEAIDAAVPKAPPRHYFGPASGRFDSPDLPAPLARAFY